MTHALQMLYTFFSSVVAVPDMLNTPGIYYAISYWCCTVLLISVLPSKRRGIKKWTGLSGLGIILGILMVVTKNAPGLLFIMMTLVELTLIYLMIWFAADIPVWSAIYYTVRSFISGEFLASFEWQMLYFFIVRRHMTLSICHNLLVGIPVYAGVLTTMWLLERHFREANRDLEISRTAVLGAVLIGMVVYFFSNLSFVYRNTPFSARYTNEILLLRTAMDLNGILVLYMYHVLLHRMHAQMEVKTLQNMLDMQYANYVTSRDSIDLVNRKYHDLKHQIEILRRQSSDGGILSDQEKNRYLDRMEADIRQYEAQNKTGNPVLDTILTSKSLVCQRHHIEMTVVADGHAIDFMDTMDISSLFGNAVDNAIESVRKFEQYAKRLIHLTVVRQKSFTHITVENTYTGTISFRNGLPVTTKKDNGYHGFGVKSMRTTVEKYGGSLTVSARDGWFRLNILIPFPENKLSDPGHLHVREKDDGDASVSPEGK